MGYMWVLHSRGAGWCERSTDSLQAWCDAPLGPREKPQLRSCILASPRCCWHTWHTCWNQALLHAVPPALSMLHPITRAWDGNGQCMAALPTGCRTDLWGQIPGSQFAKTAAE